MSTNQDAVSRLRRRMIEDMTIRHFTARTQGHDIRHVRAFAVFLRRSPERAEPEDLRRFQLHMVAEGSSPSTMNAAVSALRFFFGITLGRVGFGAGLAATPSPERLPVVLSTGEVARLLGCAPGLKYQGVKRGPAQTVLRTGSEAATGLPGPTDGRGSESPMELRCKQHQSLLTQQQSCCVLVESQRSTARIEAGTAAAASGG